MNFIAAADFYPKFYSCYQKFMGQLQIKANLYSLYYVNLGFVEHMHCIHAFYAGIFVPAKAGVVHLDLKRAKPGLCQ